MKLHHILQPTITDLYHRYCSLVKDPQEFGFEPLESVMGQLPLAYRGGNTNMGFLTTAGGENVILDGQHRHAVKDGNSSRF